MLPWPRGPAVKPCIHVRPSRSSLSAERRAAHMLQDDSCRPRARGRPRPGPAAGPRPAPSDTAARTAPPRPATQLAAIAPAHPPVPAPGQRSGIVTRAATGIQHPCGGPGQQPVQQLHRPDELQRRPPAGKQPRAFIAGAVVRFDRRAPSPPPSPNPGTVLPEPSTTRPQRGSLLMSTIGLKVHLIPSAVAATAEMASSFATAAESQLLRTKASLAVSLEIVQPGDRRQAMCCENLSNLCGRTLAWIRALSRPAAEQMWRWTGASSKHNLLS